jgi:hypothetical protein
MTKKPRPSTKPRPLPTPPSPGVRRWSRFEKAVLLSLYRSENNQRHILRSLGELLTEGPNNQALAQRVKTLAGELDDAIEPLEEAIEQNTPPS